MCVISAFFAFGGFFRLHEKKGGGDGQLEILYFKGRHGFGMDGCSLRGIRKRYGSKG